MRKKESYLPQSIYIYIYIYRMVFITNMLVEAQEEEEVMSAIRPRNIDR